MKGNEIAFLVVLGCVVVGGLSQMGSGSSSDDPTSTATDAPDYSPMRTDIGNVGTVHHGDGLACPATRDKLHDLIHALVAKDQQGLDDAMTDGGIQLHRGERVRVIQKEGFIPPDVRLRIIAGDDNGVACWVEGDMSLF